MSSRRSIDEISTSEQVNSARSKQYQLFFAAVAFTLIALQSFPHDSGELMATEPEKPKRVLVLFSHRQAMPINLQWDRGIRSALEENYHQPLVIDVEYLDAERLEDSKLQDLWIDLIRGKYQDSEPDLVIPVHDLSTSLFVRNYQRLFPNAAVVICSIDHRLKARLPLTSQMTGLLYRLDYDRTLECAMRLIPKARKLIVVSGTGIPDTLLREDFMSQFSDQRQLEIEYWTGIPDRLMCAEAKRLPPDSFILFLAYERDRDGQISASSLSILRRLAASASVPVFGLYDTLLDMGILGGYLAPVEEQGRMAGEMAVRILQGEAPSDIPFTGLDVNRYAFDHRQLIRWRIPERDLPGDSIILFREPTIWQRYGAYLATGLAALSIQMLMIVGLLVNRSKRLRAESILEERLRFETLLADVSSRFVHAGRDELSNIMEFALRSMAQIMKLDVAALYRLCGNGTSLQPIASVVQSGVNGQVNEVDLESFPWFLSQVKSGCMFTLAHLSALPDLAVREKEFLASIELRAGLVMPLTAQGKQIGLVIYGQNTERTAWDTTVVQRLQIVTEVLKSALAASLAEEELAISRQNAQWLSGRLLNAIEDERRHLAREMHDDLSQRLALAAVEASNVEHQVEKISARAGLKQLREHLITISDDVHRISRWLHPSILEDLGLPDAVRSECNRISSQEKVDVKFYCNHLPSRLPNDLSLCLYRVIQEGLRNALKHARADRIDVKLSCDAESVYLSIKDFGCGFDPMNCVGTIGLGISSMQERVRLVDGSFAIRSAPDRGTCIDVIIPLPTL